MRINTNVSAMNAYGNLSKVQDQLSSSMQKLSSGFRINKAGDDAAGLGIANQLRGDIGAMQQASDNADQASSVLQIMDGATQNVQSILERMKELAAQSASDTVDDSARTKINNEFQSLSDELDRIVNTTKFEGANLLDGTFGSKVTSNGAVDTGSSIYQAHVGSVSASDPSKVALLAGNVTASVQKTGNTLGANFNSGVALTVTSQSTVDSLDASQAVSVNSVTQNNAGATFSDSTNTITAAAVSNQTTAKAEAAGTWTISTAVNSGDANGTDITFTNGVSSFTASDVQANAANIQAGGLTLTLKASASQADLLALSGGSVTLTQNYDIKLTGGGVSGGQTASIADDGTAKTASFSNYGLSFSVASGSESGFTGKAIGLTENDALQLTDGTTTQQIALNANPASQTLDFTQLGLTVNLSGSASIANLKTDFAASHNTIQRTTSHQAQFLVSASQNYTGNDLIDLSAISLSASTLGVSKTAIDLTSASGAQSALTAIDGAITQVGDALGSIGAAENRISYASANVKTSIENFTSAESTIRDVDMASEMTNFSKEQILSQAGTAMLAQANQLGASVLKLLQ